MTQAPTILLKIQFQHRLETNQFPAAFPPLPSFSTGLSSFLMADNVNESSLAGPAKVNFNAVAAQTGR